MPPNNVIRITEYKNRNTVKVLEEILEKAKNGEVTGMIFALRLGDFDHGIGITGSYAKDPISAVGVAGRIVVICSREANKMMKPGRL